MAHDVPATADCVSGKSNQSMFITSPMHQETRSRTTYLGIAHSQLLLARRCVRRIATGNEALEVANSFKSQWSERVVKLKLVAHLKSAPDRVLPTRSGVVDSKKASRTGAALLQGNYFLIFTTEYLSMDGLGIA